MSEQRLPRLSATAGTLILEGARGITVSVQPYGPDEDALDAVREELARGALRGLLRGARYRWLTFKFDDGDRGRLPQTPERFTATVYDYTNRRTIDVAGRLGELASADVEVSGRQPVPSRDEWVEAVSVLTRHPAFGPALSAGTVRPNRPMPPLMSAELADGRSERVITVGLTVPHDGAPEDASILGGRRHRMVGVNLLTGEVTADVAPEGAHLDNDCGSPFNDSCPSGGSFGQAIVTVHDGTEELWRLLVVRPAASSGTNGSGVELRDVSYRGSSVLRRAHAPILNVEYQGATVGCGPTYRDWLDQEACFQAVGQDVSSGIRVCESIPKTILESGSDTGNFRGVAVHMDGPDLLLTSELSAGWYRYITEWRLRPDGSIRPRMGFSAVENFCTCQQHIHHGYWRLDWALTEDGDHRVEELNTLNGEETAKTLLIELFRRRNKGLQRRWRITHRATGVGYVLVPGPGDGEADLYGAGDAWFLRYHPNEIDDRQGFTTNPLLSRARLDLFANAEWIDGEDLVTWYACHWDHAPGQSGSYLGPELQPLQ